jgi:Cu/Ag efflux protein CusF
LAVVTLTLSVTVATVIASSWAGASSTSIVAFNGIGLAYPYALTAHGQYVWIGNNLGGDERAQVIRVNARTGAHLTIKSPLLTDPYALVSDGTAVWVEDANSFAAARGNIARIDIATGKVTLVRRLTEQVHLAVAGPYLWAANGFNGTLLRINRTTLATTTIASPLLDFASGVTADTHYLWVARAEGGPLNRGSLTRISLATGAITAINSPYFNDPIALTSNGRFVWMPASNHVVVKVDIATGKVTKVSSKSFSVSIAITSTSRYTYVASDNGNPHPDEDDSYADISQIDDATGSVHVITSKLITSPSEIVVLGSHVWVDNQSSAPPGTRPKNLLVRITP